MDILICLTARDFKIVKKVISGCRKYLQQPKDRIFIVTNKNNEKLFTNRWKYENNVIFLDEDQMIPGLSYSKCKEILTGHFEKGVNVYPGWYLQQFLKMGFSLTRYAADDYLIWDSDTIPLRKIDFLEDGKYLFTIKTENHLPYFDTMRRLVGFGKLNSGSFIAEHMPIKCSIMKKLIEEINRAEIQGNDWYEKIMYATSGNDEQAFSEFETYGNYCVKYHPNEVRLRSLNTLRKAGYLYGRGVSKHQLGLLAKMDFDTASFEMWNQPDFPGNIYNWIERIQLRLYREFGLIGK